MLSDLLFEIGTEELPSAAVWPLADALANNITTLLSEAKLNFGEVRRFATPRRMAFFIHDVQVSQESQSISKRGPACASASDAEGNPLPSLLGFAASCGVSVSDLSTTKTDKGEWWIYEAMRPGSHLRDLLPTMIHQAVSSLAIPKPMRWGFGDELFVRPVHWAVLLLGDEIVNTTIFGIKTGRQSFGHRFHHPQAIEIKKPRDYEGLLNDAFVIADFAKRRQTVLDQVDELAKPRKEKALMPASLVDEVTSIVEWPQALLVDFEAKFLDVPPEALIAAMQSHQKCFAMLDQKGQLLPHFVTVANIASRDTKQVIKGNESVMRARLSDAAFFYNSDRQQPLHHYYAATANVVFQKKLGSLQDKMKRIQAILAYLVPLFDLNPTDAMRASELSKCDLMSGMVGEFPELQGTMGSYYARHDGERPEVALALKEQYLPRFSADDLPSSPLGLALSLADRLDTLVGSFALGQKPTGTKDPYQLRRHALAMVRLLVAVPKKLELSLLISHTLEVYGDLITPIHPTMADLKPFILERMLSFYQGQGVSPDRVHAVRACQDDGLFDMDQRIKALIVFAEQPEAISLSAACKRVTNFLQQSSVTSDGKAIDESLFQEPAEKTLYESVQAIEVLIAPMYATGEYGGLLGQLARLRVPVDNFFEHVMVMVDDNAIKTNRLRLLARLQQVLKGVADISLLTT
jgi:glycyl-tRNA synthetase beta chain